MSKLVKPREFRLFGCRELRHMPVGLGNCIGLQVLDFFVAKGRSWSWMNPNSPSDSDDYEVGGLTDLNHLNNLKGGLTIKVDGKWSSESEARAANLQGKEKLTELGIEFVGGSSRDNEMMLEGFQPNVNLRNLWIEGYRGQSIPSWIDNKNYLSNLQQISISGWEACIFLGSFGRLPYLKILKISLLPNLEYIEGTTTGSSSDDMLNADANANFDHHPNNAPSAASLFPSLEALTLHLLPKLKGWSTMCASKSKDRCFSSAAGAIIFPRLKGLYLQMWD